MAGVQGAGGVIRLSHRQVNRVRALSEESIHGSLNQPGAYPLTSGGRIDTQVVDVARSVGMNLCGDISSKYAFVHSHQTDVV